MTLAITKNRSDYVVLVKVFTLYPGHYHAVAETDRPVSVNGDAYEPRLLAVSEIVEALPRSYQARPSWSSVTIEIANPDGYYNESLRANAHWMQRVVHIYRWLPGTLLVDTEDLVFKGFIETRNGVTVAEDRILLRVSDYRNRWDVEIPAATLETADYPHLPEANVGRSVPLLYGDFGRNVSDFVGGVEAICVDTGVRDGEQAQNPVLLVAQPFADRLGWIDTQVTIVRSPTDVTRAATTDRNLTAGTFELDRDTWEGDGDYEWQAGDTFFVKARGETEVVGVSENLLENPAAVIRHLILHHTGATEDDIDAASYSATFFRFTQGMRRTFWKARRHITRRRNIWEEIASLAFEFGIELGYRAGKITFAVWEPFLAADDVNAVTLDESDIVEDSFEVLVDPDGVYANELKVRYNWSPGHDRFLGFYAIDFPGVTADPVVRELEFLWQYHRKPVASHAQRLAWLFSVPVIVYRFRAGFRALSCFVGQRIRVTYPPLGLDGRDVQIRSTRKDLLRGVVEIVAWDAYLRVDVGHWAPGDAPDYEEASDDQRNRWGFWTDAEGRADPQDEASKISKWI